MYNSRHDANPGQGPPVTDQVAKAEDYQHTQADEQRVEDDKAATHVCMDSLSNLNTDGWAKWAWADNSQKSANEKCGNIRAEGHYHETDNASCY